jgi:uncharacterized protein (TIGR01777 family)
LCSGEGQTPEVDVAVTGSGGLIGSALVRRLREGGHRVRRVVRSAGSGADEVRWDPMVGTIDSSGLVGVDAVVHLAGEGIGDHRWTEAQKRRIRDSRVTGTTVLAEALARLDPHPAVLLTASGISVYGDRGDEVLTEASGSGTGFLPSVVEAWEAATKPAATAGIRTASFRNGIVLSADGGALAKQLPLFRFGVGGRLGPGTQWVPWIAIDDEVSAIVHLLTADVEGPVNLCSPEPVTNATFTEVLGRVLGRPTLLPVPRFGPRLLLGRQLADELLFWSVRAVPERLTASGFTFAHPDLEDALRSVLGRPAAPAA